MAVGIFDSGLGGLTILEAARARLPELSFTYFADSAHAPYGTRDFEEVYRFTSEAVQYLWRSGCDLVIVACNTASTVVLRRIQQELTPPEKRAIGVFVPLLEALTERSWADSSPPREVEVKHVALFATPTTVRSRAFQRELAFRAIGVDVEAQACAGLVEAIERGDLAYAESLVFEHVEQLHRKMPSPDTAVLGCTHYPLLQDAFSRALGPDVKLLSQAKLVAESLVDYLARHPVFLDHQGAERFLTSGDPVHVSMRAELLLDRPLRFSSSLL